jgi:predicted porin
VRRANVSLNRPPVRDTKDRWQVLFITNYKLSKTTDIYLTTAYAKNAGLNLDTSQTGFVNGYFLGAGKQDMLGVAIGIRQVF